MQNNDKVCKWWIAYTFDNPIRKIFHSPEKMLKQYINPKSVIADIGCGLGYFSIGIAKFIDNQSKVISIDLQQEMLDRLSIRAKKHKVSNKITPVKCNQNSFCFPEQVDFALTFWMLHETPDLKDSLQQIYDNLKPNGKLLVVEPGIHVSDNMVDNEKKIANRIGFKILHEPSIKLSKAILFQK